MYAGLEDFGIAPVEAMASGAPVIGLGRGLLDTVRCAAAGIPEPTGVLFPEQTVESLVKAVEWFEQIDFGALSMRKPFVPGLSAFGRKPSRRALNPPRTAWSAHQRAVPLQRVTLRRCQGSLVTLSVVSPRLSL